MWNSKISPVVITNAMLSPYLRMQAGKPPLVSKNDRQSRRISNFHQIKRLLFKPILFFFPSQMIKLKWRYLRGEIRERRIIVSGFKIMAVPLRRFTDYSGIGKKILEVTPLENDPNLSTFK